MRIICIGPEKRLLTMAYLIVTLIRLNRLPQINLKIGAQQNKNRNCPRMEHFYNEVMCLKSRHGGDNSVNPDHTAHFSLVVAVSSDLCVAQNFYMLGRRFQRLTQVIKKCQTVHSLIKSTFTLCHKKWYHIVSPERQINLCISRYLVNSLSSRSETFDGVLIVSLFSPCSPRLSEKIQYLIQDLIALA